MSSAECTMPGGTTDAAPPTGVAALAGLPAPRQVVPAEGPSTAQARPPSQARKAFRPSGEGRLAVDEPAPRADCDEPEGLAVGAAVEEDRLVGLRNRGAQVGERPRIAAAEF